MKPLVTKKNNFYPYILLFVQPIFMASNIIVARGGVEYVPPVSLAFWRWLTVFLILMPFFFNEIKSKKRQFKKSWPVHLSSWLESSKRKKLVIEAFQKSIPAAILAVPMSKCSVTNFSLLLSLGTFSRDSLSIATSANWQSAMSVIWAKVSWKFSALGSSTIQVQVLIDNIRK